MLRRFRSLIGTAALALCFLSSQQVVGVGQYWFLRWQWMTRTGEQTHLGSRRKRCAITFRPLEIPGTYRATAARQKGRTSTS